MFTRASITTKTILPKYGKNISRSFSGSARIKNAEPITKSVYKQKLDEYFNSTNFEFLPEKSDVNLQALKAAMDVVYLRQTPLVSFDVEAYERSPSKVTEIGIAVYDPEASEHSILPIIHQGHIIIEEHKKLNNKKFCPDNKQFFMGGASHMATMKQAGKMVTQVMNEYIVNKKGAFVGHHIEGDIKWLKSLGIKIADDAPVVDTSRLYSYSRRRGATLRGVLRLVGIPHGYLHNAGNDAYYTLLAVMALCDPEIRKIKGLDSFVENERLTNPETRLMKFSDMAKILASEDGKSDSIFDGK